ncbi:MAG: hypothetical protein PHD53_00060 [Methylococcales bacterium]|nr:hypothetical protein [Methylococcales bacterium]
MATINKRAKARGEIKPPALKDDDDTPSLILKGALKLKNLSNDELAQNYKILDGNLAIAKGMLLLEGRLRFGGNDRAFGAWITETGLNELDSQQNRNRFMALARYFTSKKEDGSVAIKDMNGISPSVGFVISEVRNRDIAKQLYYFALGRSRTVKEVDELAAQLRGEYAKKYHVIDSGEDKTPPLHSRAMISSVAKPSIFSTTALPSTVSTGDLLLKDDEKYTDYAKEDIFSRLSAFDKSVQIKILCECLQVLEAM